MWWNVFRMIEGGKTLEDFITVEDTGTFTCRRRLANASAEDNRPYVEDICAENNFSYFGYDVAPLPQTAKPDF
jgi:hypothetical protein